jgi:Heterokaryon incompatibility protein (HET)
VAVEWLDHCKKHHHACTEEQETFRPTRLLDLESVDITRKIRLVLSGDNERDEPYVTLSHCWGSATPFRLTTKTLERMRIGLDLEELPKTFRDAIEIASWFQGQLVRFFEASLLSEGGPISTADGPLQKVRYIWIDSCCIVQDSTEDWLREAKMMEKVYKNTYFNISASHSKDTTGGCFTERLLHRVVPCHYEAPSIGRVKFLAEFEFMYCLDHSALSARAWVVQERFHSPRVLHFTADQLFWECAELFACETFPEGLPACYDNKSSWHYRANMSLAPIHQRDKPQHYEIWGRICEDYSKGKLTHSSDKLIAFSGIVREFQSRLPSDKYLAGMWKGDLVSGLLWSVVGMPVQANNTRDDGVPSYIGAPPTPTFRAPSWSWLSIDDWINWSVALGRPLVRVLDATVDLVSDCDPSGEMRGGSIVLRGLLRSASWKQEGGLDFFVLDGKHGDQLHGLSTDPQSPTVGKFSLARDTGSMFPVKDIFCLLVSWFALSPYSHAEMIEGLVLRSTEVKDTYRRLGYFKANGLIPCMALKYKLRPSAQEMDRPWDKFCLPPLGRRKKVLHWFRKRIKVWFLSSTGGSDGSVEKDTEAGPADAYLGDAPYDELLFEKLEERTITLV